MKKIKCPGCPNDDFYRILMLTEDYVLLECYGCGTEFAVTAARDEGVR